MEKIIEEIYVRYIYNNDKEMNLHKEVMLQDGYELYADYHHSLLKMGENLQLAVYCLEYKKRLK